MPAILPSPILVLAILFAFLSFTCFIGSMVAYRKKRIFGMVAGSTLTLLLFVITLLLGALSVGLRGYQSFVAEEVAAVVTTKPLGDKRFSAQFRFPDGSRQSFELMGDQLYVDAHILKWKPLGNFFGLHTGYELDRVTGRYQELSDEKDRPRTVFSLAGDSMVDLFALRQRFSRLSRLMDAEYGSATFIPADAEQAYELRVSTSGLLFRRSDG